jgi:UrcA family protein
MQRSSVVVSIVAALLSVIGSIVQLGVVAAAVAVSVASATAAGATPAQAVGYEDLDLTAPAGAAILYARIQAAAKAVCGDAQRVGSRIVSTAWRTCVATAVERAVTQVDRPTLTAYHEAKTGAPSLLRTAALARPDGRN